VNATAFVRGAARLSLKSIDHRGERRPEALLATDRL
jgi:hypothetical protein